MTISDEAFRKAEQLYMRQERREVFSPDDALKPPYCKCGGKTFEEALDGLPKRCSACGKRLRV